MPIQRIAELFYDSRKVIYREYASPRNAGCGLRFSQRYRESLDCRGNIEVTIPRQEAAIWLMRTFRVSPDMQTYRPAVNIVALWSLNSDPACSNEDTLKRKNDESVLFQGSCDGM